MRISDWSSDVCSSDLRVSSFVFEIKLSGLPKMPLYRSRTTTHGRNMAGARGLWRATGMKDSDFGKPIIAVVNSFTQFVPGHVHPTDLGQMVAREIEASGGVAKEFKPLRKEERRVGKKR